MKRILALLLVAPLAAPLFSHGAEGGYLLDRSPHDPRDLVSLQSGARTYMNYCLGCHGLQFMRYDGLKGLGLSEAQIRDNLMFSAEKVGVALTIKFTLPPLTAMEAVVPAARPVPFIVTVALGVPLITPVAP